MSDHTILTLPAARAREAVGVLTDAFMADPAFAHVLPTRAPGSAVHYQRLGFDLIDAPAELFPGGPPMWIMHRPAQPPGA